MRAPWYSTERITAMICDFCEFRCDLSAGSVCRSYAQDGGKIAELDPFSWTTCRVSLCEDIPFFHYYPRTRLLELGGARCNASCGYCINARIVDAEKKPAFINMSAEEIIKTARLSGCAGIHFGINEVTCNLISALEIAEKAKSAGLKVSACTNGYMTEETASLVAGLFDGLNISLKSISPNYYREVIGLPDLEAVKRNISFFAKKIHIEVTTPVAQGINDGEMNEIAGFLAGIDRELPWHIFRLIPEHKMKDIAAPDVRELAKKVLQVREVLPYTYFSNFIGSILDNTLCPECGATLIRRLCVKSCGATLTEYNLTKENTCPVCGKSIRIAGHADDAVWRKA